MRAARELTVVSEAIDDYRWLVSSSAAAWLERASAMASAVSVSQLVAALRKELSPARTHLVAEQTELRARGAEKFSDADRLFFTKKGLEQATDEQLARYKAERFAAGARVADLCCGIGGDLIALAGRGPVLGIDCDPIATLLAEANLRALELPSGRVETGQATPASLAGCAAWHCDPDRRAEGRRTTTLEQFSPDHEQLDALLSTVPSAAVKLAPATAAPDAWQTVAEREWLGSRRECRQQVAWFGGLARHPGKRVATIIERGLQRTIVERGSLPMSLAERCGRYLFEPHSAVLAADLTHSLAVEHGLCRLSARVAYLTGDGPVADLALDAFEVLDVLPFDRKQLKAYCRERRLGRLEVKKRGVEIDPHQLRQELAAKGDEAATILISPVAERVRAIVARRIT